MEAFFPVPCLHVDISADEQADRLHAPYMYVVVHEVIKPNYHSIDKEKRAGEEEQGYSTRFVGYDNAIVTLTKPSQIFSEIFPTKVQFTRLH